MAERRIFSCDICATEREQTNHWFAIVIGKRKGGDVLTLAPLGTLVTAESEDHRNTLFHLCGEGCVARKVSEFLSEAAKA